MRETPPEDAVRAQYAEGIETLASIVGADPEDVSITPTTAGTVTIEAEADVSGEYDKQYPIPHDIYQAHTEQIGSLPDEFGVKEKAVRWGFYEPDTAYVRVSRLEADL